VDAIVKRPITMMIAVKSKRDFLLSMIPPLGMVSWIEFSDTPRKLVIKAIFFSLFFALIASLDIKT
jgi:hypothetical protein